MTKKKPAKRPDYTKCVGDIQALQRKVTALRKGQRDQIQEHQDAANLLESLAGRVDEIADFYQTVLQHVDDLEKDAANLRTEIEQLRAELRRLAAAIAAASTGTIQIVSARALAISRSVLEEEVKYYIGRYVDARSAYSAICSHTDSLVCHQQAERLLMQREDELRELEVEILDQIMVEDDFDPETMVSVGSIPASDLNDSLVGKVARVDSPAFRWHDAATQPQIVAANVATFSEPGSPVTIQGIAVETKESLQSTVD